ncbi:MAG: N-acetylneuraminate synthase family protein [Suilimivivens sp.]
MNKSFQIGTRRVGEDAPVFIVAELSANHNQDYNRALEIVHAAKEAGADAVKLQTYTADTITLDCDDDCFRSRKEPSGTARHFTNSISRPTPPGNGSQS